MPCGVVGFSICAKSHKYLILLSPSVETIQRILVKKSVLVTFGHKIIGGLTRDLQQNVVAWSQEKGVH